MDEDDDDLDVVLPFFDDEDEEEDKTIDEAPTASTALMPNGLEHIRCIVNNKIQLIGLHPLTGMVAQILLHHFDAIMKIVSKAIRKKIDDVSADWIREHLESCQFKKDEWERIYNCRSYLLEFARCAASEGQLQKDSDALRAIKYRMLRVDEIDTSGRERGSKRPNFSGENADEDDEDDQSDPYLKDFLCDYSIYPEDYTTTISNFEQKEEANFMSTRQTQNQREDFTMDRRHQLRAQFSSDIGFVSALGKGMKQKQSFKNSSIDNADGNNGVVEESERFVYQRKKRTPIKQLNHSKNNGLIVRGGRKTDATIIRATLKIQKAIIQSAADGRAYESVDCESRVGQAIAVTASYKASIKSCLKKKNQEKRKNSITFSEDVFDKIASGVYVTLLTKPKTGQSRANFFSLSFDSLSINSSEIDDVTGMYLPNCDVPIKPRVRENPLIGKKSSKTKDAIKKDFYSIMGRAFFAKKVFGAENKHLSPMLVSRLLITDSMLSSLDCEIFRNMDLMKLDFPRMPVWFLETLGQWFDDDKLTFVNGGVFPYSKVFISLGLDLLFYYADELGDEIQVQINFLRELVDWFKVKVEEIRKFVNKRERGTLNQKQMHSKLELFYKKSFDNNGSYEIVSRFKIVQIPTFVIITTPEIGGWKRHFVQLNKRLRDFVKESPDSQFFDLLDWAELVKSAPSESVNTAASRVALLINSLHKDHGVFYV